MEGKIVVVIMAVLSALLVVPAQAQVKFPINETICKYENPAAECETCCEQNGYGAGSLVPVDVARAANGDVLRGSYCLCTGSTRLVELNKLMDQQAYFFERTTAPLQGGGQ